jgi:UDP-3-O-[3-hydroxymyristoyl] N-acetylglucosamine deacetylase
MTSMKENTGMRQRTLASEFTVCGKGIHTGRHVRMTVYPAEPDIGICFLRSDQPFSHALVLARWSNVVNAEYSTNIANEAGVTVRTVEHLMAAFRLAGVDNALVTLDGPEVPAVDGSADPFIRRIEQAGTVELNAPARTILVLRPVQVRDGNRFVRLSPSPSPRLIVTIDYPGTVLGMQSVSATWNRTLLTREIAPARTFGFASDHSALMERGHALGADLGNTIVVEGKEIRNLGGLRYEDEFVRHKMLDAIGDLYLAGWPIQANYEGYKPGHTLNVKLLRKLFEVRSDAWTLVPPLAPRSGSLPPNLDRRKLKHAIASSHPGLSA